MDFLTYKLYMLCIPHAGPCINHPCTHHRGGVGADNDPVVDAWLGSKGKDRAATAAGSTIIIDGQLHRQRGQTRIINPCLDSTGAAVVQYPRDVSGTLASCPWATLCCDQGTQRCACGGWGPPCSRASKPCRLWLVRFSGGLCYTHWYSGWALQCSAIRGPAGPHRQHAVPPKSNCRGRETHVNVQNQGQYQDQLHMCWILLTSPPIVCACIN
jgi:hypothetical protein